MISTPPSRTPAITGMTETMKAKHRDEQPLPPFIDRFAIEGVLSEGGMGVLHRGRDTETGQPAAIKVVRRLSESHLAGLRREIHVLSRISHPAIVRVLAHGVLDDGRPWYAMDLLDGETVAQRLDWMWPEQRENGSGLSTIPCVEPSIGVAQTFAPPVQGPRQRVAGGHLEEALLLVARLCRPLGFLHGEGIVHCDLKPLNVLLRAGSEVPGVVGRLPVLVDFGLASVIANQDARAVTHLPLVGGTPAYMAPEQVAGEVVDARTDLYALGCMLYELLTGQTPFTAATAEELFYCHREQPPRPPSELVDGVSPALDALVCDLLAKQPHRRPGHCDVVIERLAELGVRDLPPARAPETRAVVYRPALAGRDGYLDRIADRASAAARGKGSLLLVGGESGIGKTSLVVEGARRARHQFRVVTGSCLPAGAAAGLALHPLHPLLAEINDRCFSGGAAVTARILGARGKALAAFEPSLGRLQGVRHHPDPPDLSGPAAREHLFACLAETIEAFAQKPEKPLLLLLDDLQWADELTLHFLLSRPRGWLSRLPLFVLGTFRSEEMTDAIVSLLDRDDVDDLRLDRLDDAALAAVTRGMLAVEEVPPRLLSLLSHNSEGNPFFVAEYLRDAIADGRLERVGRKVRSGRKDDSAFGELALPRTLRELVRRRLDALGAEARELVEIAAVLGKDVDPSLLAEAGGIDETRSFDAIEELTRRQMIEPTAAGPFRFVHDKLREGTYQEIDPDRRTRLHGAAAAAIERRAQAAESTEAAALAGTLAHHFALAENAPKAIDYFEKAGARALATAAYGDASGFYSRALALAPGAGGADDPRRARWHHAISRASFGLGNLPAFERHTREALSLFGHPLPSSAAGWSMLLARQLLVQRLHLAGIALRTPANTTRDDLKEAALAVGLASFRYFYSDDPLPMIATSLLSANLAERVQDVAHVPRSYALLGAMAGLLRRSSLAARYFDRAHRSGLATNDPSEQALCLTIESVYHASFGRWHDAARAAHEAEERILPVRDPVMEENVQTTIGHVEFYSGRIEAARTRYLGVLASARKRNNQQHAIWGLFSTARSLRRQGSFHEARALLIEAEAGLRKLPEVQSEIICFGLHAAVALELGHLEEARLCAGEARDRIERSTPTGFPSLEGYDAAAEVYGELAAHEVMRAHRAALLASGSAVRRSLFAFAVAFPVARPSALLHAGLAAKASGHPGMARALLTGSLQHAEHHQMPREAASAHLALARLAPSGSGARTLHADAAARGFARLGCSHDLARAMALR